MSYLKQNDEFHADLEEIELYLCSKIEVKEDFKTKQYAKVLVSIKTVDPKADGKPTRYIEKVRYGLDSQHGIAYKDVKWSEQNQYFEFDATANGAYYEDTPVPITITLRKGCAKRTVKFDFFLNFDVMQSQQRVAIPIKKDQIKKFKV